MIVDTHCHVSQRWYEPVESLLFQLDRVGVERAWLIQPLNDYDNGYQQACARRHRDRLWSFVGIDWTRPDGCEALRRAADDGAVGVRLRPGSRSPDGDALALWRLAAELGLVVSCVGTVAQFAAPAFADLVRAQADLPIVLEHLGGLARPDAGDLAVATAAVAGLAALPNLFLKVPGLGQIEPRARLATPPVEGDGRGALVRDMIAAFGADRLAWGSDHPVVSSREGYANALAWTRTAVPAADRAAVFGETAGRLVARRTQRAAR